MKRWIGACVALVLLLASLSACGTDAGAEVNGSPVGEGVCLYFDDLARSEDPDADEAAHQAAADKMLAEYVAINAAFTSRGLSLTVVQKAEVSQTVNDLWRLFGDYYTNLGVTKQDLWKVKTSEAYKDAVMTDYYAADGDEPVDEATLQAYFSANYIAFQSITGFLTTVDDSGNAVALSDTERANIVTSFENMASAIAGGSSVAEEAAKASNTISNPETVVVSRADENYSDAFFEHVFAMENNTTSVFTDGDYVFLVLREDITDTERNLFADYRTDCLRTLKGEEFDTVVAAWAESYAVTRV